MAKEISTVRIAARYVIGIVAMSAAFFGTAGNLGWPEAWVYMILQFFFSAAMTVWLKRHDPELLRDRMKFLKSSARKWDKAILWISTLVFVPYLLIPGLDAVRYRWSSVPLAYKIVGFSGIAAAFLLITWVTRENTYLSRIVEIQKERGHTVVTTGPYRFVRHPMYLGVIVMLVCTPLALGSLWSLIPAAFLIALIIIRTHFEDRVLREELAGYKDYSLSVVYRLVRGIW